MLFVTKPALAMTLVGIMLAGGQTLARINSQQSAAPVASANTTAQLTGKERLGEKWQDEQRIDNCKVPLDKRGTKQRSDSCAHLPTS